MTCQSSESPEAIEDDRGADDGAGTEESDESRVASAMKELRKTGGRKSFLLKVLQMFCSLQE